MLLNKVPLNRTAVNNKAIVGDIYPTQTIATIRQKVVFQMGIQTLVIFRQKVVSSNSFDSQFLVTFRQKVVDTPGTQTIVIFRQQVE